MHNAFAFCFEYNITSLTLCQVRLLLFLAFYIDFVVFSVFSYLNSKASSADYVENIFRVRGEKSIANNIHISFIIAGIKEETVLELASSTANISRQTTSKTKSATDMLYVIQDESDIPYIEEFLSLRETWKSRFSLTGKKDFISNINNFIRNHTLKSTF